MSTLNINLHEHPCSNHRSASPLVFGSALPFSRTLLLPQCSLLENLAISVQTFSIFHLAQSKAPVTPCLLQQPVPLCSSCWPLSFYPILGSALLPYLIFTCICSGWVWPHPSGKAAFSISASPWISLSSLSLSCWHHSVEHAFLPETVPAPGSHDTILFGSLTYTFFAGSSPLACPKLLGVP